jgi:ferritin-like metal-binding protein YciE
LIDHPRRPRPRSGTRSPTRGAARAAPGKDDMDTKAQQKVIGYLNEAHATESALVRTLEAHVAVTPTSAYRTALDRHLRETRQHAQRVRRRLSELGATRSLVDVGVGIVESLVGQALALGKGPVDLVRGDGPEEKLLKNAKDEAATEALEIATYDALEAFARGWRRAHRRARGGHPRRGGAHARRAARADPAPHRRGGLRGAARRLSL